MRTDTRSLEVQIADRNAKLDALHAKLVQHLLIWVPPTPKGASRTPTP